MKVGRSDNSWARLADAQTWHAEPIQVLRIYPVWPNEAAEEEFHNELVALGCDRAEFGGGSEWFSASMEQVDQVAAKLGLTDAYVPRTLDELRADLEAVTAVQVEAEKVAQDEWDALTLELQG